jgi:anti-anti-sigma regulatory factor
MPFTLTKRQVSLILIGGTSLFTTIALLFYVITGDSPEAIIPTGMVALVFGVLFGLLYSGWEPARYIATVTIGLIVAATLPDNVEFMAVLIPMMMALALTDTRWVAGVGTAVFLVLMIRGGIDTVYLRPGTISSYVLGLGSLVMGSLALDSALALANRNAQNAEAERVRAEERAIEVSRQAEALQEQNTRQRELIDLVATLETPSVQIADGVLLAPVVGTLDSQRAQALMSRLLDSVYRQRTRLVILDVVGVPLVDTAVAQALTETVRAVHLLGCAVTVTGISAEIATTLIHLGVPLNELHTAASPQEALAQAQARGLLAWNQQA